MRERAEARLECSCRDTQRPSVSVLVTLEYTAGNRQGQLCVAGEPSGSLRRASERSEGRTRKVRAP